mmetsp:Transcript_12944/g.17698  ORF Transcript_12944/g.17698 Transcript_12944/m.17698 type:complete len:229 (-) Transcript_12944:370-1056(-)
MVSWFERTSRANRAILAACSGSSVLTPHSAIHASPSASMWLTPHSSARSSRIRKYADRHRFTESDSTFEHHFGKPQRLAKRMEAFEDNLEWVSVGKHLSTRSRASTEENGGFASLSSRHFLTSHKLRNFGGVSSCISGLLASSGKLLIFVNLFLCLCPPWEAPKFSAETFPSRQKLVLLGSVFKTGSTTSFVFEQSSSRNRRDSETRKRSFSDGRCDSKTKVTSSIAC